MFRDHTRTRIYDLFYMITKTRSRFETPLRRRATPRSCSRRTIITRRCIVALASTSPASAAAAVTHWPLSLLPSLLSRWLLLAAYVSSADLCSHESTRRCHPTLGFEAIAALSSSVCNNDVRISWWERKSCEDGFVTTLLRWLTAYLASYATCRWRSGCGTSKLVCPTSYSTFLSKICDRQCTLSGLICMLCGNRNRLFKRK